jgi:hypothetical protein
VGSRIGDRTVHEREHAVDAPRQQRRILVVRPHHQPAPFEADEIVGQRERNPGTAFAERGIGDRILAELRDEGDARVFQTPQFLGVIDGIGRKRRYRVDHPARGAIRGARRAEMRVSATVFDPAEQQRRSIREQRRAGVEDRVYGVWPVRGRQNGIAPVAVEQRVVLCGHHTGTGTALTAISTSAG